jgi:hypothetical protein
MPCLGLAYSLCRRFAALSHAGHTSRDIMRIGRKDMNFPLVQHSLGQILRIPAKRPGQGTACHLHPDACLQKPVERGVLPPDPGQSLGMREDRDVPCHHDTKEKVLDPRRRHMMWRFHKYIACIGQREQSSGSQSTNKICDDVIVGTSDQAQRHSRLVQHGLQVRHGGANLWPGVVIEPGQNMRRARHDLDSIGYE